MQIGMLWFDDSPRPITEKVRRALSYYQQKYGREPTLCLVNPSTLPDGGTTLNGIEMRHSRSIMPNHFWLGLGEKGPLKTRSRKAA